MTDDHPLYDRRVQVLIGLLGPTVIGIFGIVVFDGIVRWSALGIAVVGAIVMPYALRVALENTKQRMAEDDEDNVST